MYLTTHRVRSPRGQIGINGALYRSEVGDDISADELTRAAEGEHGGLLRARTDLPPGGNAVDAFVDIAAPDQASPAEVRALLDDAAGKLDGTEVQHARPRMALRFSCNLGLAGSAPDLLQKLGEAALELMSSRPEPSVQQTLDVVVDRDEERWLFTLGEESWARARAALPGVHVARTIGVPFDVAEELRRTTGRLYPLVVEWLTGTPMDRLRGWSVRFVSEGELLWRWPR